jgi:hypothetical protein
MRALLTGAFLSVMLTACGGGSDSSDDNTSGSLSPTLLGGFTSLTEPPSNNAAMTSCSEVAPIDAASTITGVVEYERIPLNATGLNYSARSNMPARAVVVEAVDASNGQCSETVVTSTLTNANGQYGLTVPDNQSVCVQVRAQLYRAADNDGGGWDIQVTDNTQSNAAYYLVDNLQATPSDNNERNFLAASGALPGSKDYTGVRAAAPFAVLDTVCESVDTLVSVDSQVQLPLLQVHWSINNIPSAGDETEGEIGGAFFRQKRSLDQSNNVVATTNEIFLLGDEDNNTDEYDVHVISHEFGHFVINNVSRTDAYGGAHTLGDHLDMRVAFDEGWADAYSGMVLDATPNSVLVNPEVYRDTLGGDQDSVFSFNLSNNNTSTAGWYSESSVFSTVYNIFDADNSGADSVALGFAPLYQVITSNDYQNSDAFITIFSFINQLKLISSSDQAIDALLADQDFEVIIDDFGTDENVANNNLTFAEDVDFVYRPLTLNEAVQVCSNSQFGSHNKLSVRQYFTFDAGVNRSYRFNIAPVAGRFADGQASFQAFQKGGVVVDQQASSPGDTLNVDLTMNGRYVLSLASVANVDNESTGRARHCFSINVE